MKGILLCLVFFVDWSVCYSSTVDTFEFGINIGIVSFGKSGSIGPREKDVRVPIVLPACFELTYVRVDVDNRFGPPHVTFDPKMMTVRIMYRRLQYSRSTYVVTAKAIRKRFCE